MESSSRSVVGKKFMIQALNPGLSPPRLCVCVQTRRRGRPEAFQPAESSTSPPCTSAKKTTCCTSAPGRFSSLSTSPISAQPSTSEMWEPSVCGNINAVIIGSRRHSMNMVVNMIQPRESSVNITPRHCVRAAAWVWLRGSLPAAHVDHPGGEKRRVQFQRQRPAGKWAAAVM